MRVALVTEGGCTGPAGSTGAWCERLVHALTDHDFEVYALEGFPSRPGAGPLPPHVTAVRTAPCHGGARGPAALGRRAVRRRFLPAFRELARAVTARPVHLGDQEDRFARFTAGLYGLAELAGEHPGPALAGALRSDPALRALDAACRAPGADPLLSGADLRTVAAITTRLERLLRPLTAPWYGDEQLGAADLCHATCGGPAALPGLVAARRYGTPLLVTEHRVPVREHHLDALAAGLPARLRVVPAAFHRLLAGELYRQAAVITSGNGHIRRWQQHCGAPAERLRTIHPGLEGTGPADAEPGGRHAAQPAEPVLVWVGTVEPGKDLEGLLHAFAAVRQALPAARLRIAVVPGSHPEAAACLSRLRVLADRLFPGGGTCGTCGTGAGGGPVSFEQIGSPQLPGRADAYAAGEVVVLSSAVEGFPLTLAEAMLCGRATVSTDTGAVREVIGGTGLVVPPRNPGALADGCLQLLRDPARRALLGAAARARALELFSAEGGAAAYQSIYRQLAGHRGAPPAPAVPFAVPAELRVPPGLPRAGRRRPAWAREPVAAGTRRGGRE